MTLRTFQKFQKVPLILSLIFLLLSCGLFIFLYQGIKENNTIAQENEDSWQKEQVRRDDMKTLDRSLETVKDEAAILNTHFAEKAEVVPFLDMIENSAPNVGAKAVVTLVDGSVDPNSLVVEVQATGSFESIYKFLLLLENSQYELDVVGMNIKKLDTGWSGSFRVKLLSFLK